jgi:hypothetical protein
VAFVWIFNIRYTCLFIDKMSPFIIIFTPFAVILRQQLALRRKLKASKYENGKGEANGEYY